MTDEAPTPAEATPEEKKLPSLHLDIRQTAPAPDPATMSPAQWAYMRLAKSIVDFEAKLDKEHEIGMRLVSFANREVFNIENVGYWAPDILKFYGLNSEGHPVELIQHVSQLNVMLVAAKKTAEEPRRIGFTLVQEAEKMAGTESKP